MAFSKFRIDFNKRPVTARLHIGNPRGNGGQIEVALSKSRQRIAQDVVLRSVLACREKRLDRFGQVGGKLVTHTLKSTMLDRPRREFAFSL